MLDVLTGALPACRRLIVLGLLLIGKLLFWKCSYSQTKKELFIPYPQSFTGRPLFNYFQYIREEKKTEVVTFPTKLVRSTQLCDVNFTHETSRNRNYCCAFKKILEFSYLRWEDIKLAGQLSMSLQILNILTCPSVFCFSLFIKVKT